MDITYCNNKCATGMAMRNEFLAKNNSVFEAAADFSHFTENCFKTCPYKEAHNRTKEST